MDKIRTIIVDDEIEGINTLDYMLKEYCPNIDVIGKFESSVEALKAIKKEEPDLLFLDIKMPLINGLELLELLKSDNKYYNTIFVTAFDEFILQALRLNALDYLKKPISEKELVEAVGRVKKNNNQEDLSQQLSNALKVIKELGIDRYTPIGIKEGNKVNYVNLIDITHCESDGNFTKVFLEDGNMIYSSYSLRALEDMLPEKYFMRLHREYIVNGIHVMTYDKSEGGCVVMRTKQKIPISRGKKDDFLDFMNRLKNIDF